MNAGDRKKVQRIMQLIREVDILLEEWQDIDRTMTPGHMDKVFNNYGSGRSDQ